MVRTVVERGATKAEAARAFNTTPKTVAKWVAHLLERGAEAFRRQRRRTQTHIAADLGHSPATVRRILGRQRSSVDSMS
ncbi:MAG: helix-turn-helix domain-containing protein [Hyphomicrobium sp.]